MAADHSVPLVSATLLMRSGSTSDPEGQAGLASLAAALLTEGAGGLDAAEYARRADRLGASISAGAGFDSTVVSPLLSRATFRRRARADGRGGPRAGLRRAGGRAGARHEARLAPAAARHAGSPRRRALRRRGLRRNPLFAPSGRRRGVGRHDRPLRPPGAARPGLIAPAGRSWSSPEISTRPPPRTRRRESSAAGRPAPRRPRRRWRPDRSTQPASCWSTGRRRCSRRSGSARPRSPETTPTFSCCSS